MEGAAQAGGDIVGSMIGGKNQQAAGQQAAQSAQNLTQQTFNDVTGYQNSQEQKLRTALQGVVANGNPYFTAGAGLKPTVLAPGQNAATFGGQTFAGGAAAPGGPSTVKPFVRPGLA